MNDGYGALMKALRERAGITQEKMAEELNVDQATISRYENGRQEPTMSFISRWGNITASKDVIAAYILDGSGAQMMQYIINQNFKEARNHA
ncbi:helix-turn-helix domain-containing protein [Paenibacillus durus]|uniref:HTH cro/C1-type domain-containing protein n=1 Tax=Paenibacillus durus ATCC 35681 TaxID=1333534 RepID=A0A0F7FBH9_PAEDU|nr:helix-turn-helix transcriptional regulator [Paenibacillus durus]AKG36137.1 hypothetical protein VK70_17515 [Paenibacillus durus ATCC 35681]